MLFKDIIRNYRGFEIVKTYDISGVPYYYVIITGLKIKKATLKAAKQEVDEYRRIFYND